jgi:spore coat polysaccharide biosynthesis protein SpsF
LAGKALLLRMAERVLAAHLAGTVVIATTTDPQDDVIESLCQSEGLLCFRGHPTDLLDRHYQAALHYGGDIVLKIPSDCPLIDPAVIDKTIQYYIEHASRFDYVGNLHPPTYPDGNDVEIMPLSILAIAHSQATQSIEREHTTPYIWQNPQLFRLGNLAWETGLDYSQSHRFTIDYPEDYAFIKRVYDELYAQKPLFGLNDILQLLEKQPDIIAINEKYAGVTWYSRHLASLQKEMPNTEK